MERGRKYSQALLNELHLPEYPEWIAQVVKQEEEEFRGSMNTLFRHLLKKVQSNEKWTNLEGGGERRIAANVPKIIGMALKVCLSMQPQHAAATCSIMQSQHAAASCSSIMQHLRSTHFVFSGGCGSREDSDHRNIASRRLLPDLQGIQGYREAARGHRRGACGVGWYGGQAEERA